MLWYSRPLSLLLLLIGFLERIFPSTFSDTFSCDSKELLNRHIYSVFFKIVFLLRRPPVNFVNFCELCEKMLT